MEIREFIEARAAELEADAHGYHRYEGPGAQLTCDHIVAGGYDRCTCGVPAWLLREVAAQRRMAEVAVAQWKAAELLPDGHRECAAARALAILQFLAEPFADHPDLDPAWRING